MARYDLQANRGRLIGVNVNGTRAALVLNASLVYGTSGAAFAVRLNAHATTTLTDVYVFLDSTPGAGNGRNLRCYLCGPYNYARPGTEITHVDQSGGETADKWVRFQFSTSNSLTKGNIYWLVIGDPSVGTGTYDIVRAGGGGFTHQQRGELEAFTSAAGFSSNGSGVAVPPILVAFGDGVVFGSPFSESVGSLTSTIERGLLVGPMDEDVVVTTLACNATSWADTDTVGLKCYEIGTAPGGTIYSGFNGGAALVFSSGMRDTPHITIPDTRLKRGQSYRFTWYGTGGAFAGPNYYPIIDLSSISSLFTVPTVCANAEPIWYCEANGGAWIDYNNATDGARVPSVALRVKGYEDVRNMAKAARLIGAGEL